MRFGREKRLVLGAWALLAPLPLPFNEVLSWPVLIVYEVAVGTFLWRASRGQSRWLPNWSVNLLALAYLPILYLDLRTVGRGQLVTPILHLALFVIVVKLLSLKAERDKWHAALGLFFLFLASMATSVHPSLVLYLLASLALGLLTLARFTSLDVLGRFEAATDSAAMRMRGFVAWSLVLVTLLAVPLFALLPRIGSPYIPAPTPGVAGETLETGLADEIGLDVLGRIRESRVVVMRVAYDDGLPPGGELRFKGATYDLFDGLRWKRTESPGRPLPRARGDLFRLRRDEAVDGAEIWLQPVGANTLLLPVETLSVRVAILDNLFLEPGGAVTLWRPLTVTANYRVGLGPGPISVAAEPAPDDPDEATLDVSGVTPAIAELAAEVAGEGSPAERARRLNRHLLDNYGYTLDLLGRGGARPIEVFLFERRSGHCELFATSLVLLLRAEGIPARLVSGFFGGEYNPLEGYVIVRELNAHAWVEAFLPEEGWVILDPTPPAGRPGLARFGFGLLLSQAWDSLVFRWERHVLTYGVADQMRLLGVFRDWWGGLWERFRGPERPTLGTLLKEDETVGPTASAPARRAFDVVPRGLPGVALAFALLVVLGAVLWALRSRGRLADATAIYRRLRDQLLRVPELELDRTSPPGTVASRAAAVLPEAKRPLRHLVGSYLRESFGGESLAAPQRRALGEDLEVVEKALRHARKRADRPR